MNAPFLWVIVPLIIAAILLIFRHRERPVQIAGFIVAILLTLTVWNIPISESFSVGPFSIRLADHLDLLGRQLILENSDRGIIGLIYLIVSIWFAGAIISRPGHLFVPLGLAVVSLLVASLVVEPFLFAALFIQLAVIVSIPVLVPPGGRVGQGILRFLSFQTLGVPFILFTGWMLSGVEATPTSLSSIVPPAVLMGFGFAFLLAVFPFHTWLPMLAEEVHPYLAAFIFLILPGIISLFGLSFLDRFSWLRQSASVYAMLRAVGFTMVVTGGVWAAFQRHLGRMMGFAAIVENGVTLLAIGSGVKHNLEIYFLLFLPRILGYFVWAQALVAIRKRFDSMWYRDLQGIGRVLPFSVGGLVLAQISVAGFPVLAGFPARLALWQALARQFPVIAFGTLLASLGILIGVMRTLAVSVMTPDAEAQVEKESRMATRQEVISEKLLFFGSGVVLLLFGIFPYWFLPVLSRLPLAFEHLMP